MRGSSSSAWASRSARPGSPGSRTRSATGACGRRWTGSLVGSRAMAKKKEKGKSKQGSGGAADALREAVERTFQGAAGGAAGAQKRVQDIFDELNTQVQRLRETVDER